MRGNDSSEESFEVYEDVEIFVNVRHRYCVFCKIPYSLFRFVRVFKAFCLASK